jgi:penicillin-binding protein 1C
MLRGLKKIFNWIKRKKYYVLSFILVLFIWWYNCLPNQLFIKPTSTILLDNKNELLNAQIAIDGQWRFPHNNSVPEKFKKAIIQFEDKTFYSHFGVSIRGIVRAIKQNISEGRIVSGGSTITMQVIRMSREKQRTVWQKIIEMILATRLEARCNKDEILSLYASNAPMGGNIVGLDAASWRYFGRDAHDLSWAETSMLAVLPNAPSLIHLGKNRDKLFAKRNRLLDKLFKSGEIDSVTYDLAIAEPLPQKPHELPQVTPHLLAKAKTDGYIGSRVSTTINRGVQEHVLRTVDIHHNRLKNNHIYNGAVIVGNIKTGEIIAYVGNTNVKEKEHGGAVDIITAPRSSGSILKPFLYAYMLDEGLITPNQLTPDIPTTMAGYSPENYNQQYAGAVPASEALSRSLNVPFVLMLKQYGVAKFHSRLKQTGMTTLVSSPGHYGLSLILGGAEVTLLDLINMYGKMAKSVSQYPNYNTTLNINFSYQTQLNTGNKKPLVNAAASWFTIEAMKKLERPNRNMNWETFSSSQNIAWKTGTSYGFRDAWAVGFNSEYIVGVWVGNADGEGRPGVIGVEAAAPILFDVFDGLPKKKMFIKPHDELEFEVICAKSGFRASDACDDTKRVLIPLAGKESEVCPYHLKIHLDKEEQYRVTSNCELVSNMVEVSWFVLPTKMEWYYQKRNPQYIQLPPFKEDCKVQTIEKSMVVLYPKSESEITIPVGISGKKEKTIFEVTHRNEEAILYWHIDDMYIGITSHIHQLECNPSYGKHKLTVVDNSGEQVTVNFEVIKEGD